MHGLSTEMKKKYEVCCTSIVPQTSAILILFYRYSQSSNPNMPPS